MLWICVMTGLTERISSSLAARFGAAFCSGALLNFMAKQGLVYRSGDIYQVDAVDFC